MYVLYTYKQKGANIWGVLPRELVSKLMHMKKIFFWKKNVYIIYIYKQKVPTFEVFYRGDMVSKINGPRINEVQEVSKLCHIIIYREDQWAAHQRG